ncbi:MAG TPA: TAXI family TRAP transporter solute-binding subunit [Hyphomicrobiaceae bacterium]|nr:TAXI family TRAP transporter solute-binding subunit [Hyphomicrobiaceae bacterium]
MRKVIVCGAVAFSLIAAGAAVAQDGKLPATLTFTAYDTGTSGFNITVAVGKAFKDQHNTDVRVLPAGNDVARLSPIKSGRAQVSAMGMGTYFAQEAVFEFATRDWGPQSLQLVLSSVDCNGANLGIAKDTGVTELKDLKGKRVGFVVGAPSLNQNALASLAFGGLTRDDVKIVEFSSFGAMWKGMINNDVDAAFASTITAQTKEVETSPRGLVWPTWSHDDKAAWERVKKIAPFFSRHVATCGSAGLSAQTPKQMGGFPYPVFVAYASQPEDVVYGITKAMIAGYDAYKDAAPGASGLAVAKQTKQWVVPFHAGSVRALKEVGQWTAEDEAHNAALLKRQGVLAEAWSAYLKTKPADDQLQAGWMQARKAALVAAAMEPVF